MFNELNLPYRTLSEVRINGFRVDLCIINLGDKQVVYKIEFKYHFSKDLRRDIPDHHIGYINKDYAGRNSDMFVLIVAHFSQQDKLRYDNLFGIVAQNSLAKYVFKDDDGWISYYDRPFTEYNSITNNANPSTFTKHIVKITEPYEMSYTFYSISKTEE